MNRLLLILFMAGCGMQKAAAQNGLDPGVLAGTPYFTIFTPIPAEIDFTRKPTRILIAPLYKVDQLKVARDKKEELIQHCLNTFLRDMAAEMKAGMSPVEVVVENDPFQITGYPNDISAIAILLEKHRADLLFGIDQFRPQVEKAGVEVVETPGGTKDRTATYLISASGSLRLYNTDSLLREFPFYTSAYLKERKVVSGLLAAGPSLVNNADDALAVSALCARNLVKRMLPSENSFVLRKFSLKEFRAFNRYMDQEDISSAMAEAVNLTDSKNGKIKGRAHIMLAMLLHKKGDFDAALAEVEKAIPLTDAGSPAYYRSYLVKYGSARLIKWK